MTELARIGLGTFPLSNVFSQVDKAEAKAIVHTFLDLGGKYIDTAPLYQLNDFLRSILAGIPRDLYFICDKCVTGVNSEGEKIRSGKYDSILAQCDLELKTLGVDYIDLYMMHIPPSDAPPEETMSALVKLQKEGKIHEIGVSNINLAQLKEFNSFGRISYIQNRFSLLNRSMGAELVQYCKENDIKNIPYQVIERGLLTEKIVSGFSLREGDLRIKKPEFNDSTRLMIGKWVANYLKPLAVEFGVSVENIAIWWALQQPGTALCAIGATSKKQVIENMKAINLSLPVDTLGRIEGSYQILATTSLRTLMGLEELS